MNENEKIFKIFEDEEVHDNADEETAEVSEENFSLLEQVTRVVKIICIILWLALVFTVFSGTGFRSVMPVLAGFCALFAFLKLPKFVRAGKVSDIVMCAVAGLFCAVMMMSFFITGA